MDGNRKNEISHRLYECTTESSLRDWVSYYLPFVFFNSDFVGLDYSQAALLARSLGWEDNADLLEDASRTLKVINS